MKKYPEGIIKRKLAKADHVSFYEEDLISTGGFSLLENRGSGNFIGRSFLLPSAYDWSIVTDNENALVLVPTKKRRN